MTQRMRLVPEDPTAEMIRAIETQNLAGYAADAWDNAIAASPNGGCVTDADLERAARAFLVAYMSKNAAEAMAAALAALGLALASQPTQTGE
jgi:hypothetical protein